MAARTTAPAAPHGIPELPTLPLMCGPLHDLTGRTGFYGYCGRAHRFSHLYGTDADIRDSYRRLATLERKGLTWRAGNLRRWITEATERHTRILALIMDRYPCTHPAEQRHEMTFEEALPDCTC